MLKHRTTIRISAFLFFIVSSKIIVFQFLAVQPFGIIGDADQYHAYALGLDDHAYNLWSLILRFLAETGWYSRKGLAWLLLFMNIFLIPLLAACACVGKSMPARERHAIGLGVAILISLYPPLYFYALDVYRDEFMMFVFVLGLACIRPAMRQELSLKHRVLWGASALFCIWVLYLLRPYLGFAVLLALPIALLFDFSRARLWLWLLTSLVCLNLAFAFGLLDRVAIYYRAIFSINNGNTNLGIVFDSPWTFLIQFARSWIYQVPGIYFPNIASWFVFIVESIPFLIASAWLLRNRRYADRYVSFLVAFFFLYSTVWVLGNDNLGAAIRLRMFNYVAVLLACAVVFGRKRLAFNRTPTQQNSF